jgi:hypothetical protein
MRRRRVALVLVVVAMLGAMGLVTLAMSRLPNP